MLYIAGATEDAEPTTNVVHSQGGQSRKTLTDADAHMVHCTFPARRLPPRNEQLGRTLRPSRVRHGPGLGLCGLGQAGRRPPPWTPLRGSRRGGAHPDRHDHRSGADRVPGALRSSSRRSCSFSPSTNGSSVKGASRPALIWFRDTDCGARDTALRLDAQFKIPKIPEMTVRRGPCIPVPPRASRKTSKDDLPQELAERFSPQLRPCGRISRISAIPTGGASATTSRLKAELQDPRARPGGRRRLWGSAPVGAATTGVRKQGFRILAIFDDDPAKWVGGRCVQISPLRDLPREAARNFSLPSWPCPRVRAECDREASAAGIKAVLNFAPGRIASGKDVRLKNVDLSIELSRDAEFLPRPGEIPQGATGLSRAVPAFCLTRRGGWVCTVSGCPDSSRG